MISFMMIEKSLPFFQYCTKLNESNENRQKHQQLRYPTL